MKRGAIRENIENVRKRIADACRGSGRDVANITLVCVTKGVEIDSINGAIACGIADIGENRVQEAIHKYLILHTQYPWIKWHMVGHLQRNKVKDAMRIFDVIHSVDSLELAEEINKRTNKKIDIFIQINISGETAKSGMKPKELSELTKDVALLKNLRLKGLMTIAPLTHNLEEVRPYFRDLRILNNGINCSDLSMGMSNDFEVAIEEGATYVRIGTAIFKE